MNKFNWLQTIRLNLLVFKAVGLWPDGKGYKLNLYLLHGITTTLVFAATQCICQTWKLMTNLNDLEVITGTAFLSVSESLVVVKMSYLARNIKTFKKLLVMLNSHLFQPRTTKQVNLVAPSLNIWRFMYNLLGSSVTLAVIFYALTPILTGSTKTHRLPFIASYPFDTTSSPFYQIIYLHQVASILFLAYINVNLDTFLAAFSLYAGAQLDILCDDFRNIEPDGFREELLLCVNRYREIIRYSIRNVF